MTTFTLNDLLQTNLDRLYKKTAGPSLSQIQALSTGNGSQMQLSLKKLDEEASRLAESDEKMKVDNAQLEQTLLVYLGILIAAQGLIKSSDNAVQDSTKPLAVVSVTARVFGGIATALHSAGIDPMNPSSLASFNAALVKSGISWNSSQSAMDAVAIYVESQAWIDKMEKWGEGYYKLTKDSILTGIQQGYGPKRVAQLLRQHAENIPVSAANSLMRTLQVTAYRDNALAVEKMNGKYIKKKIRIAKLDNKTCLTCIALHGTILQPGERVDDHYNGRCSEFYVVPGGPEMPDVMQADSTPGNRKFVGFQTGEDWFNSLSEERQRQQASFRQSPGKYEAFKNGAVHLPDFVGDYDDKVFGNQKIELSLKSILGDQAKDFYTK